eukprot:TRINITY_DN67529_c3_g2_i3.p1 TRINITY_DN67529_c3_g2~~TRINITY_DN67529_c3_g2_i3.p1  ORF type:complete len:494 (+),score=41.30 TRINITY_DN67529_c3_g2_i3:58-1539(+)
MLLWCSFFAFFVSVLCMDDEFEMGVRGMRTRDTADPMAATNGPPTCDNKKYPSRSFAKIGEKCNNLKNTWCVNYWYSWYNTFTNCNPQNAAGLTTGDGVCQMVNSTAVGGYCENSISCTSGSFCARTVNDTIGKCVQAKAPTCNHTYSGAQRGYDWYHYQCDAGNLCLKDNQCHKLVASGPCSVGYFDGYRPQGKKWDGTKWSGPVCLGKCTSGTCIPVKNGEACMHNWECASFKCWFPKDSDIDPPIGKCGPPRDFGEPCTATKDCYNLASVHSPRYCMGSDKNKKTCGYMFSGILGTYVDNPYACEPGLIPDKDGKCQYPSAMECNSDKDCGGGGEYPIESAYCDCKRRRCVYANTGSTSVCSNAVTALGQFKTSLTDLLQIIFERYNAKPTNTWVQLDDAVVCCMAPAPTLELPKMNLRNSTTAVCGNCDKAAARKCLIKFVSTSVFQKDLCAQGMELLSCWKKSNCIYDQLWEGSYKKITQYCIKNPTS